MSFNSMVSGEDPFLLISCQLMTFNMELNLGRYRELPEAQQAVLTIAESYFKLREEEGFKHSQADLACLKCLNSTAQKVWLPRFLLASPIQVV